MADRTDRRCFLARGVLGAAGIGAAYKSIEENTLLAAIGDGTAAANPDAAKKPQPDVAPGSLPCGKIRDVTLFAERQELFIRRFYKDEAESGAR